jgi:hypothetical protein
MAVGKFFNSTTNRWTRLAEQWNGTSWALKATKNASGETFSTLTGVSCASPAACTAVGGYALLAEQWNGTSWANKATPSPTGTTFADFTGVSCSAASACTAAGGFATTSGAEFPSAPLAERWNGTSWALQTTPNPASEGFAGSSCPAATSCAAVGSSFAEGWNGVTWATQSISTLTIGEVELAGVSCSAVNACTAGGRSVQNYLIAPLFANSIFINAMNVPVAERDPAASSNRTPGRVSTPGPPASVKRSQIAHLLR